MAVKARCTEYKIRALRLKLLKGFKRQFKFNIKCRNTNRPYMSKIFRDEVVSILDFKYNLITCRHCKKVSRAYLNRSRECIKCFTNSNYLRARETFGWSSWANIA